MSSNQKINDTIDLHFQLPLTVYYMPYFEKFSSPPPRGGENFFTPLLRNFSCRFQKCIVMGVPIYMRYRKGGRKVNIIFAHIQIFPSNCVSDVAWKRNITILLVVGNLLLQTHLDSQVPTESIVEHSSRQLAWRAKC